MLTAFKFLASPVPGLFVHFYLQSVQKLIEPTEQLNNTHELKYSFVIQPELPHRESMNRDSILTPIHCRYSDSDDFLGETVKFA